MVMLSNVISVAHTIHSVFDKNMLHKVFLLLKLLMSRTRTTIFAKKKLTKVIVTDINV